ncbi:MAG: sigma 54-dependent Fis family transcriptional regulator [Myxococcota bacterium]|nr:sigma 54-dependent Fis family transcriptional regulator [Myxococcota bacterium]
MIPQASQGRTTTPPGQTEPAQTSTRPVPRLQWHDDTGPRTAKVERRCVLGSAPHCDIIIADPAVSRVHAEIEPREDGIWIRDLNSRNGTFVEGVKIESASVMHGFTIHIGASDLLVDYANVEHKPVESWPSERFGPLVGKSRLMRELFATLAQLASLECCIMIAGETGTGKELVARAVHQASPRASAPFVVVDCATLSESLIEAELFGHMKGSFTGAHQNRAGAFEAADGGTVFLDEIGELPISMQPKLLRVLESLTVRRLGESKHRSVNVRFLSATHRDLLSMVNRGEFREDLYFRLAVVPVRVPALRERVEDIDLLLTHFSPGARDWLTPKVLRALQTRPWRGNVRELRNFAERARAIGPAEALNLSMDPAEREPVTAVISRPLELMEPRATVMPPSAAVAPVGGGAPAFAQPFRTFREQWIGYGERAFLRDLLERHQNNVAAAAKEAEIDRTYIYRLIRKHAL